MEKSRFSDVGALFPEVPAPLLDILLPALLFKPGPDTVSGRGGLYHLQPIPARRSLFTGDYLHDITGLEDIIEGGRAGRLPGNRHTYCRYRYGYDRQSQGGVWPLKADR